MAFCVRLFFVFWCVFILVAPPDLSALWTQTALHGEPMLRRYDEHPERVFDLALPTHDCEMRDLRRLGGDGDGGQWVCGLHRLRERLDALAAADPDAAEDARRRARLFGQLKPKPTVAPQLPVQGASKTPALRKLHLESAIESRAAGAARAHEAALLSRADDFDPASPSLAFAFGAMYDAPCVVYAVNNGVAASSSSSSSSSLSAPYEYDWAFERDVRARVPSCEMWSFGCSASSRNQKSGPPKQTSPSQPPPPFVNAREWCANDAGMAVAPHAPPLPMERARKELADAIASHLSVRYTQEGSRYGDIDS
jgi:hypothetical protein